MFNIILSLIYFAISLYLMNKAKNDSNDVKAATLDSFDFPTADETRSIPFGYGTFEVNGPNVLWFGDYSTNTIYQEVKSGGFLGLFQNTDKVNAGFAYNVGLHFGLCFGGSQKEVNLKAIKIDDKYIFTTNSTGSFSSQINNKTLAPIVFDRCFRYLCHTLPLRPHIPLDSRYQSFLERSSLEARASYCVLL